MKYLFNYLPRLSQALSGGSFIKASLLYFQFLLLVLTRRFLGAETPKEYLISGTFVGVPMTFHLSQLIHLAPLIEVYALEEYDWDCGFVPKTILDLGAHFGDTALYYNAVYPGATIIAVEPDPENFARLQKNVGPYSNIIPVHVAVGESIGMTTLFLAENGLGHSTARRDKMTGRVEVPQTTITDILQRNNLTQVDLIKFDIEGAEAVLFKDVKFKDQAKAFIGELHPDLSSEVTVEGVKEFYKGRNVIIEDSFKKSRFIVKVT